MLYTEGFSFFLPVLALLSCLEAMMFARQPGCMTACVPALQSAGKGVRAGLIKCGQCKTCLNPQMKKPCLNPIMQPDEGSDGGEGSCSK